MNCKETSVVRSVLKLLPVEGFRMELKTWTIFIAPWTARL